MSEELTVEQIKERIRNRSEKRQKVDAKIQRQKSHVEAVNRNIATNEKHIDRWIGQNQKDLETFSKLDPEAYEAYVRIPNPVPTTEEKSN